MKEDKVIEEVCNDLKRRSKVGIEKYGATLEEENLPLVEWLQHAYEETLDKANYLKKAIMTIKDSPIKIINCNKCDGDGKLEIGKDIITNCDSCHGSGKTILDERKKE